MAWQSVRVLDGDLPVGYTENDYYFTGNRSSTRSMSQGGWSDITFTLTFALCNYNGTSGDTYFRDQPPGDYYLVGDAQAGIFVRKKGNAGSTSGTIEVKASYNGQADSGGSMPEVILGSYGVRSNYSEGYYQISIICGIDEENHRGTIFGYRKWNTWINTGSDFEIHYCVYGRYTNSEVAYNLIKGIMPVLSITSNGGGATHIAKRTGQLKDLSSYTSDILMVSGGGGGGLVVGETDYSGKEAGGISGSGDNSANQSIGNAFGLGESGTDVSGGGSGLYGGYKGTSSKSGGAGSGYIGNSLLFNKKMVGYNVPTSSAEATKTESVNEASTTPVSNKPKIGNGFARVKLIQESIPFTIFDSETEFIHPSFTDDSGKFIEGGDGGSFSWRYRTRNNNELYFGNSSPWGANYGFKWKQAFRKGTATKLYMECECDATSGYSYHTVTLYVAKNLEWGGNYTSSAWKSVNIISYASQSNYAGEEPWTYMHKTLVEIPLDDVGNNDIFYIGFHKCDCGCYITKIYFNGEPRFVQ